MRPPTRLGSARLFAPLVLWALAGGSLGGCTRFELLNATVPSCGYRRTAGLAYGELPRQKLDVYRPRSAKSPRGVVVFIYGGSWQSGRRADYRFAAEALTSRGFVAVVPDYRLYPSVTFPAFVEDAALAVRWVRDNAARYGGDPDRVYLMGHSAGAHTVAMLTLDEHYLQNAGVDPGTVRAAAALAGPYDFIPDEYTRPVFGMSVDDNTPPSAVQPIAFVDGTEPPLLLLHGSADDVVGPGNAARLAARIRAAGGEVKYIRYRGLGHVGAVLSLACPFRWRASVLDDAAAFFRDAPATGGGGTTGVYP